MRHVREAVAEGDAKRAQDAAAKAGRALDKAASAGVIHKNQAANRKSAVARAAGEWRSESVAAPGVAIAITAVSST